MSAASWEGRNDVASKTVLIVLLFGLSASVATTHMEGPAEAESTVRELALLQAANDYREAQGLNRWQGDPGLAAIARAHSHRMQNENRLSHVGFRERALRVGGALCLENLVVGRTAPERLVAAWLQSASHRANLSDHRAVWAGVGVAGPFATLLACSTPAAPLMGGPTPPDRPDRANTGELRQRAALDRAALDLATPDASALDGSGAPSAVDPSR